MDRPVQHSVPERAAGLPSWQEIKRRGEFCCSSSRTSAKNPGPWPPVQIQAGACGRSRRPVCSGVSSLRGNARPFDRVEESGRFERGAVTSPNADAVRRPMRSTWWSLP